MEQSDEYQKIRSLESGRARRYQALKPCRREGASQSPDGEQGTQR
jgi:hypothetical protein